MVHPSEHLGALNPSQRAAAEYGGAGLPHELPGPLLIIAGAGTGKTNTLAHRVAHLIVRGADARRILLLTFTRRAAATMTRRAERIAAQVADITSRPARVEWSGTFHAIANRLLRQHAESLRLDPAFTVLDRSDSADLLNLVRDGLGLSKQATRFPKKGTCLAIYSHAVNAGRAVEETLERAFPWCATWAEELKRLFRAYVDAKQRSHLLDYDDLLLYWFYLMQEEAPADAVRRRFDHVLVDEYQDTNALQAGILVGLKPDGHGLTVVGDDAQSIYSFRAATVRNILDFPRQFDPPAHVVTLEQNYRSTQPILDAAHVKDVLCVLRWAENPRDGVAGFRVLQLLPGFGPAHARRVQERLEGMGFDFAGLGGLEVPAAARADWPLFCELMRTLGRGTTEWQGQLGMVRRWYEPHLERLYDAAHTRAADLEQLEQLAAGYPTRERFLSELTLDPPDAVGDEAADPYLDEDYLILSTIHSAKGQEWDVVYVLNVVDGCIPSDMATGTPEEVEEERRLLYVAMTRARDHLYLLHPHRFYTGSSRRNGDRHVYAPRTRFIPEDLLTWFEKAAARGGENEAAEGGNNGGRSNVWAKLQEMWT